MIVPLLGRFKGETGEKYHPTPLAAETLSGLRVRDWINHLVEIREVEGRYCGPAFCDKDGSMARSKQYELPIMDRLAGIQEHLTNLIPGDLDVFEDFGISRSFHRGVNPSARVTE